MNTKRLNYSIGALINRLGFRLIPSYKYPQSTLNVVELGVRFLQFRKPSLTIVQVGVFDGNLSDPLRPVLNNSNNKVILVEPQQHCCETLKQMYSNQRHISIENSAIGENDGTVKMFLPKDQKSSPMASISEAHLQKFAAQDARSIVVNCMTVRSLIEKYEIQTIDMLQIDTEGFDYNILCQFFGANVEPSIVNLEMLHLNKSERVDLRYELQERGYEYIEYGIDMLAVKAAIFSDGDRRMQTCS